MTKRTGNWKRGAKLPSEGVCWLVWWTCPICKRPFVPRPGHRIYRPQRTCLAPACVKAQRSLSTRGRHPVEAIAELRGDWNERMREFLWETFGELSKRERAIVRAVYREAERRGYNRGAYSRRRKERQRDEGRSQGDCVEGGGRPTGPVAGARDVATVADDVSA